MKRIYVNEQACIGCHLCEVYYQRWCAGTLEDLYQVLAKGKADAVLAATERI